MDRVGGWVGWIEWVDGVDRWGGWMQWMDGVGGWSGWMGWMDKRKIMKINEKIILKIKKIERISE